MPTDHRRPGFRSLTAGFSVDDTSAFLDFITRAFDAHERDVNRNPDGSIMHGEILIGDSLIEVSGARPEWPAKPCAVHLHVPDPDATYERAIKAGGKILQALENKEYGERAAAVQDPSGNHWYIAKRLEGPPVPEGFHTVTPYVLTKGAAAVMTFMKQAFDATEHVRVPSADGGIMHAQMQIGDSMIELSDGGGPWKPMPCGLHVYVLDADATYRRALEAGAASVYEPKDMFYGDRECGVLDSGGNHWFISTFKEDVPKAEIERRMAAMKG